MPGVMLGADQVSDKYLVMKEGRGDSYIRQSGHSCL